MESKVTDLRTYASKLLPEAKLRYFRKLIDVDGVDPYDIPKSSWSKSVEDLPAVDYAAIVNYFVFGCSAYTCEDFKAYKSLQAYKLFVSGWVRDIHTFKPDGCANVIVTAKVSIIIFTINRCDHAWLTKTFKN